MAKLVLLILGFFFIPFWQSPLHPSRYPLFIELNNMGWFLFNISTLKLGYVGTKYYLIYLKMAKNGSKSVLILQQQKTLLGQSTLANQLY